MLLLTSAVGCGDGNGDPAGTGGSGGDSLTEKSAYVLSCPIDTLVLEIPIDLTDELDRPYTERGSANLTFSAVVTFEEQAATTLIDTGVDKVDIVALEIAASVDGATPPTLGTSFAAAPVNDFDLEVDTDENGVAGPHRLELNVVTTMTTTPEGANQVELGLGLDQLSLLLGDFLVPRDCLGPTLVGFSARFPVELLE